MKHIFAIFLLLLLMTSAFAKKEEVIPYKVVSELNDWDVIVTDDFGKVGLYNKIDKKLTIPIAYDKITEGANICRYVYKNNKVGCIRSNGETIAPIEFDEVNCPHMSYCFTKKNGKYGAYGYYKFLNDRTDIKISNIYDDIHEIQSTSKFLVKKNGKYGVLNYDGTIYFPIEYSKIERTTYPYGWIVQKNGKYGAFNDKGQPIANMGFDKIEFIYGEYVATHNNKKYFLACCYKLVEFDSCKDSPRCDYPMNKGKVGYKPRQYLAIPVEYDDLIKTKNHNGEHIAIKNGKYGILKNSYKVLPFEYENIEESKYNYIVKKNGKYGLFDGYNSKTNIEYDSIKVAALTQGYNFEADYYAVEKNGKFGCIAYDKKTRKYNKIIDTKYDDVIPVNDRNNSIAIKQNNKYAIMKPDSNKELKFVYSDFKKSLDLVKVKKGPIWYFKDPEEIAKNIAEPFVTFAAFFMWHFGG